VVDAHHFSSVDGGRLQVRVPDHARAHANWAVVGGLVRLTTGGYAPIVRGELQMTRQGTGWALAGGSLIPAPSDAGGATQAAQDALPSATSTQAPIAPDATVDPAVAGNNHAAGPVMLPSRTLGALDQLLALAPQGSRDAIRLASAIEVTIHNAESATPSVYATPIVGRTVVLVVDTSYSMRDRDPASTDASIDPNSPPSKLDVAKAEIVRMLSSLPPTTQVNIVAFSSSMTTLWTTPRMVDDAALDEAIRWVATLQPGDETAPLPALGAADAMHPDQIVFVSDGRPTNRGDDDRALLAIADTVAAHGARLDIVGIGADQDAAFIDTVASHGAGAAHHR